MAQCGMADLMLAGAWSVKATRRMVPGQRYRLPPACRIRVHPTVLSMITAGSRIRRVLADETGRTKAESLQTCPHLVLTAWCDHRTGTHRQQRLLPQPPVVQSHANHQYPP